MKNRRTTRGKLVLKLDRLWATVGKQGAECEICATLPASEKVQYSQIQPHHIIPRTHHLTRWDLKNRLWVCPVHHVLGKKNVQENLAGWFFSGAGQDWMSDHRPEDRVYLLAKKEEVKYWRLEELEGLYEQLKSQS